MSPETLAAFHIISYSIILATCAYVWALVTFGVLQ